MATILKWIKMSFKSSLYCLMAMIPLLEAKDLGVHGHLFPIHEEDFLQFLKNKVNHLSKEDLEAIRNKVQNHYVLQLKNPCPVQGLKEAKVYRVFYVDPTLCTDQDIKDHQGNLIVSKDKCVNPLETIAYLDALLFLDGSNQEHLEWAKAQNQLVKWVLTKGKPFELEEQESRAIYFDQSGVLVKKFGIQYLPAKVSQEGLKLKIEEFPLRG